MYTLPWLRISPNVIAPCTNNCETFIDTNTRTKIIIRFPIISRNYILLFPNTIHTMIDICYSCAWLSTW